MKSALYNLYNILFKNNLKKAAQTEIKEKQILYTKEIIKLFFKLEIVIYMFKMTYKYIEISIL